MNGILISKPVGALYGIVHVTPPVILVHVSQRRVDTTLSSDCVTSCGEKLRYAGSVEPCFGKTEGCSQTCTSSTDNDRIVFMVYYGILIASDGEFGLFRSQRLTCDDLCRRSGRGELPGLRSELVW